VRRIVSTLTILLAAACGPVNWSFDSDAGDAEALDGPELQDASTADQRAPEDAPFEGRSDMEAAVVVEAGPVFEASVACSVDDDCPVEAPLCGLAGTCVRCGSNADCHADAGAPACNSSTGACVECTSSSDCGNAALPYCDTTANRCVRCLTSAECGFESLCQIATHTCSKMF
jgi:hypothetical protein